MARPAREPLPPPGDPTRPSARAARAATTRTGPVPRVPGRDRPPPRPWGVPMIVPCCSPPLILLIAVIAYVALGPGPRQRAWDDLGPVRTVLNVFLAGSVAVVGAAVVNAGGVTDVVNATGTARAQRRRARRRHRRSSARSSPSTTPTASGRPPSTTPTSATTDGYPADVIAEVPGDPARPVRPPPSVVSRLRRPPGRGRGLLHLDLGRQRRRPPLAEPARRVRSRRGRGERMPLLHHRRNGGSSRRLRARALRQTVVVPIEDGWL